MALKWYYGHSIYFFLDEKTPNRYGTHTTHCVKLAWFRSKEKAQAVLDKLNSIEANKWLGLSLWENDSILEQPIYEDDFGLDKKPHSFGVRFGGYDFTIKDH